VKLDRELSGSNPAFLFCELVTTPLAEPFQKSGQKTKLPLAHATKD